MAQLTAEQRLERVKILLGMGGSEYQDETLRLYIDEVMDVLKDGGVQQEVAESAAAVGCIAMGVNDRWNYSAGGVKYSDAFNRRLIQLSAKQVSNNVQTE